MNFTAVYLDHDENILGQEEVWFHRPEVEWQGQKFRLVAVINNATTVRYKLI